MTGYNFSAQYQQNPEPPSGVIVKREWLRFYTADEKPQKFEQVIQSWDTASKDTELANFSVCTTWGRIDQHMYLLDVYRRKLDFPALKQAVIAQARLHRADVVLIEDKASGMSLIQQLGVDNFSIARPVPERKGDKVMRLHAQTAQIEGGFVRFPNRADWLDIYLHELLAFPNAKNDDQVDSTVFALAWSTEHAAVPSLIRYYENLVKARQHPNLPSGVTRMRPPTAVSVYQAYHPDPPTWQDVFPEPDGTFLVPNLYVKYCRMAGWTDV